MKKIIIFCTTLAFVACKPGDEEVKLYNDQKAYVEKQVQLVQKAEQAYTDCIKVSVSDSCESTRSKFEMELSALTTEIDALSRCASDAEMTEVQDQILEYRKMSNIFSDKLNSSK